MNHLSKVYIFKIGATILCWSIPLLVLPASVLQSLGLPTENGAIMFLRMLGWAYIALCVNYWFGLEASLKDEPILVAPIVVGLVSNGGACLLLLFHLLISSEVSVSNFSPLVQFLLWASTVTTFLITSGLYVFGYRPAMVSGRV